MLRLKVLALKSRIFLAYLQSYIRHNTSTLKNNTATTVITKHNRENKPSSRVTMIINITIVFSIICADSPRRCDHGMGYQSGARGNVSILKIIFHKQSMTKSVEAKATCHRHHNHLTYSIPFFFQQRRPTSRPATKSHGGGGRGCTRGQSQGTYPFFGVLFPIAVAAAGIAA